MSYESRISKAKSIIDGYNTLVDDDKKIDANKFIGRLKSNGCVTEDAIVNYVTWEDIENCGIPKILAKQIATEAFRCNITAVAGFSHGSIDQLSPSSLLDRCDPQDKNCPYSKRLNELAEGKRFVVYNKDGSLNREVTLMILDRLEDFPNLEHYSLDSGPTAVHKIGVKIDTIVDEDPFRPGKPLMPNGFSIGGIDWSAISMYHKQLVHIIMRGNDGANQNEYDLAESCRNVTITKKFPSYVVMLDDMIKRGVEPKLRIHHNDSSKNTKQNKLNDPFKKSW